MSTELAAPFARVCRVLDAPRSTAHYRRRYLRLVTDWRDEYNQYRPHSALGMLTPTEYATSRRTNQSQPS